MTCRYRGRTAVTLSFLFLLMSISAGWSQAARTIKIVVPYAPGSGPDILGRLLAEQIGRANGQTIFVESRPGAGTVIGTEAVARAAPDGNTVLVVAPSFVINPTLRKVNYDALKDFEPICHLAATPIVLVINSASPYRTVADLIECGASQTRRADAGKRRARLLLAHCVRGTEARCRN